MPSILITGAGRGFGRELLEVYSGLGWTLFPLVRDPHVAAALAGERCHPIRADVGFPDAEEEISKVLNEHDRALDVLVNNAGHVWKRRWLPETTAEDIEDLFRVHCLGAFRCTRAALPFLKRAARPTVVNISSRFGSVSRVAGGEFRGIYSYSIAKSAQNMLTACLDRELRSEGVRVFAVHPGRLKTTAAAVDADTEPRAAAETLAKWIDTVDRDAECGLWDLMEANLIPW